MTTTCLAHPACLPSASSPYGNELLLRTGRMLSKFALQIAGQIRDRRLAVRQTQALSTMDDRLLKDIGAPYWLRQRGRLLQNLDSYEQVKAMSRLKY